MALTLYVLLVSNFLATVSSMLQLMVALLGAPAAPAEPFRTAAGAR